MDWLDYCLPLVKRWEGLRLSAYKCPAGVWTIGYGETGPDVREGVRWTQEQAQERLCERLTGFHRDVMRLVRVPLSPAQEAALTSLVYNIGADAFGKSTLLRLLNQSQYRPAAEQFGRWNKAGGRELAGLTKRRADERALFEQGSA